MPQLNQGEGASLLRAGKETRTKQKRGVDVRGLHDDEEKHGSQH